MQTLLTGPTTINTRVQYGLDGGKISGDRFVGGVPSRNALSVTPLGSVLQTGPSIPLNSVQFPSSAPDTAPARWSGQAAGLPGQPKTIKSGPTTKHRIALHCGNLGVELCGVRRLPNDATLGLWECRSARVDSRAETISSGLIPARKRYRAGPLCGNHCSSNERGSRFSHRSFGKLYVVMIRGPGFSEVFLFHW